jgi:hypothetical protein
MIHKKSMTIVAFLLLILALGMTSLFAGDESRIGTAAGSELLVPVGGRDLAMGGADLANTQGLDAIYWNPAGFAQMRFNAGAQFSTMTIFNDINVNYAAIGVKAGRFGSFGASIKVFDFGDIPFTTNEDWDGASGRTFSPSFFIAGLTYSRMLTDAILVGVTGKLINESIPRASASAFAFDIGLQYHGLGQINGLNLGLVVRNIGSNMTYSGSALLVRSLNDLGIADFRDRPTASNQLPATVELGLSYNRSINEQNNLIVAGIFQNNNFENDQYKFGVEYNYNQLVFLRGGYLYTQKTDSKDVLYRFTAGLGLHYNVGGTDLTFDYAFRDSQYFDGNNLFSLTIGF